jgi:Flp pilus assembly protein TadG
MRHERGSVTPLFALMLIPLCGALGMAVELSNGTLTQRGLQHAADSAAVAAAMNANATIDAGETLTRYQREAAAVATQYPVVGDTQNDVASATNVTTSNVYCPGVTSGNKDCYQTTITKTLNVYLARMVGITSLRPSATAIASVNGQVVQDDCLIATQPNAAGVTSISIQGSTDLSSCYARSNDTVNCSGGAVQFKGVNGPSLSNSCKSALVTNNTAWSDSLKSSIQTALGTPSPSTISCSSNINSLTWVTSSGVQYARVCSTTTTLQLSGNLEIGSTSYDRVLYVDNVTIDLHGNNLTATNYSGTSTDHTGTTIVATNTSGTSQPTEVFTSCGNSNCNNQSGANVNVIAPTVDSVTNTTTNANDAFQGYAIVADPSLTGTNDLLHQKNGNTSINLDILGVVYTPNSNLALGGSDTSSFAGVTGSCMSLVAYTIQGNGGKLSAASCLALGYATPTSSYSVVALVQ